MNDPTKVVKTASDIAQNDYAFGILFILLLIIFIWGIKTLFNKLEKEKLVMEEKNDTVLQRVEELHDERQRQLQTMIKENKKESKERENKLMEHNNTLLIQLQSQTSSLEEITRTQAQMQENLSKIESRIEKIESKENSK